MPTSPGRGHPLPRRRSLPLPISTALAYVEPKSKNFPNSSSRWLDPDPFRGHLTSAIPTMGAHSTHAFCSRPSEKSQFRSHDTYRASSGAFFECETLVANECSKSNPTPCRSFSDSPRFRRDLWPHRSRRIFHSPFTLPGKISQRLPPLNSRLDSSLSESY